MKPLHAVRRSLLPLVPAYRLALAIRELRLRTGMESVHRLRFPVISIGNLSTGGTGKTPFTIALAQALTRRDLRVDVLSRGYGRKSRIPARVRPEGLAEEFGDEPLLIAREAGVPVYVAGQRYEAGLLAEQDVKETGSSTSINPNESTEALSSEVCSSLDRSSKNVPAVHLLDDGYQHRQIHRDVDILLINRKDWHGDLLPAGNLREPLQAARRATVLALPAEEPELEAELRAWGWQGPIWRLRRHMEIPPISGRVAAFCGIARPEQFFAGLEAAGLHLATRIAFPDHHRYIQHDLDAILGAARTVDASALITTEKDQVRLGNLTAAVPQSMSLKTVHLRLEIEDESAAVDWLASRIDSVPSHPPL
jgi:tetraacyldisaccharide 4'-kinase